MVPRTLFLRAAYDSIPFGVYRDTVLIEAPDASNSPYALPIVFSADVSSGVGSQLWQTPAESFPVKPNPFNASVLIEWTRPDQRNVSLTIFDVLGRKIHTEERTDGRFL